MKIALDYDQTYTLDPAFWNRFIRMAEDHNHEIRIVTARNPILDNVDEHFDIPVVYCDGVAKRFHCTWFAEGGEGWVPDLWIDDKPASVDNNSTATREILDKWRAERFTTLQVA